MGFNDSSLDIAALIDDRVGEGVFRVRKAIYTDPALYDLEVKRIFEGDWIFLCHESQIRSPGNYFTTHAGRHPVFVLRQPDGSLRAFLNVCPHRGSILLPFRQGKIKGSINCRFHGWAFGPDGQCEGITFERAGGYAGGHADKRHFDLTPLARLESYRGFVFGSLAPAPESLDEFLGGARTFIDLFVDQSPQGIEVLRGSSTYVCHHNWKMQVENVTDGYHVPTVHRVFGSTMAQRQLRPHIAGHYPDHWSALRAPGSVVRWQRRELRRFPDVVQPARHYSDRRGQRPCTRPTRRQASGTGASGH